MNRLPTGIVAAALLVVIWAGAQPQAQAQAQPVAAASTTSTGTAGKVATAASATSRTAQPGALRTRRYSLKDLGAIGALQFSGVDHSIYLPLSVRLDETVVSARLRLVHTFSPSLLPDISQLKVMVNDEPLATVVATRGRLGTPQVTEVVLDPTYFTEFAKLRLQFIGHYATDCEYPLHSSLWAQVSPASMLEIVTRPLALASDLALLPAPFFDRRDAAPLTLPFVLPARPSLGTVRAAGVLASWFGAQADYRPARFPALYDRLPERHAVVLATNTERPANLPLPSVEVPTIALASHPRDPAIKLLLVLGRDAAQLETAANALALGQANLSGPLAQVTALRPPAERRAWESPRVLRPGRTVRLGALVDDPAALQVRGQYLPPVTVQFRLPPDRLAWQLGGMPVELRYRYTPPREGAAQLSVHLNGQFIQAYPLQAVSGLRSDTARLLPFLETGGSAATQQLTLPSHFLGSFNKLEFSFQVPTVDDARCRNTLLGAQAAIDPDSTLDLGGLELYTEMPNLALYATAGFPFSKYPDLAQTAVVLPDRLAASDVETALGLLGRLGAATGVAGTRLMLLPATRVKEAAERDLLVLTDANGGEGSAGLLQAWSAHMPALPNGQVTSADSVARLGASGAQRLSGATGAAGAADTDQVGWAELKQPAPATLMGFESPLGRGRAVVLLASTDAAAQSRMLDTLLDPTQVPRVQGDLVRLRGTAVESFRLGPTYHVGELRWWRWIWFHLQNRALLLLGLALIGGLLAALVAFRLLRQRAARRLTSGG